MTLPGVMCAIPLVFTGSLLVYTSRRFPQKTLFGFTASLRWLIIKSAIAHNNSKAADAPQVYAPSPFNEADVLFAVRQRLEVEMRRSFAMGVGVVANQAPVISQSQAYP